jgi:multidrug efflux system membrane fusion protein
VAWRVLSRCGLVDRRSTLDDRPNGTHAFEPTERTLKSIALLASALIAACATHAATLAGCSKGPVPSHKSTTAVRVRAVDRAAAPGSARYSANIVPNSRVDVAFKLGGYIRGVAKAKGVDGKGRLLQEGDLVTRGMELARVNEADFAQKLAEAKASLAEITAQNEQAKLDFDRATRLSGSQAIAKTELDATRIKLDAASARLDAARVRVEEAQTALGDVSVRAPMDGIVLKRNVEVGTLVTAGTVAFAIADTRDVKVVFGVPDTVLETLRLGSTQSIATEAFRGREFAGRITRISPFADPKSRVFEVEVTIPNQKGDLKIGMVASLKLGDTADAAEPVAVLPLTAVVRSPKNPNGFSVYVVDESALSPTARIRDVELGEFLGNMIPVTKGLAPGEKVIVQGATLVADGESVQVIPEPTGGASAAR